MSSGLAPARLGTFSVAFGHFTVGSRQQREAKRLPVMFPVCSALASSEEPRPVYERHCPKRRIS